MQAPSLPLSNALEHMDIYPGVLQHWHLSYPPCPVQLFIAWWARDSKVNVQIFQVLPAWEGAPGLCWIRAQIPQIPPNSLSWEEQELTQQSLAPHAPYWIWNCPSTPQQKHWKELKLSCPRILKFHKKNPLRKCCAACSVWISQNFQFPWFRIITGILYYFSPHVSISMGALKVPDQRLL